MVVDIPFTGKETNLGLSYVVLGLLISLPGIFGVIYIDEFGFDSGCI